MQEQVDWILPVDDEILNVLSSSGLALSQKNIAVNINYDRSYVGKRVNLLVGAGLLEVEEHGGSYYRITDFAVALLNEDLNPDILANDESIEARERVYRGTRNGAQTQVTINNDPLEPHPDLLPVSDSKKFEWGYIGSGPLNLSAALLADALNDRMARARMIDFLHNVIGELDDNWELTVMEIQKYISTHEPGER